MVKYLVVLTALFAWGYSSPVQPEAAPTCQVCHPVDPNKINVHLIPHSHDDVGWLKTVDQYYYGSHNEIQNAGVQYIISSTVEALKEDPNRRYAQVETAFFWKWWQHQSDSVRQEVIDLVNNGQLEITNAAWSMNDEAGTNYHSTIDQFTHGLRTISETLGPCGAPTIGWQIDPFGHSREQASLFAQFGFDAEFFARIDYNDLFTKRSNKDMEVVWKGSANLNNSNVFTVIFPDGYGTPGGFCYDILCDDEVFNDDPTSPDYNVPKLINSFQGRVLGWIGYYRTNNIVIPMGTDFRFQSAEKNFINIDKLVAAFQGNEQLNVIYSTPSCYVKAVNEAAAAQNVEFTVKTDDFFPYASARHAYWTGYFTSRPNLKRNERAGNNWLQAAKQLTAFAKVKGQDLAQDLTSLKEAMGILQHHDAITGTSKEPVADDYTRLFDKGLKKIEPTMGTIITDLLKKTDTGIDLNLESCLLANVSVCETTKADRFVVTVYNPLERPVTHYVRLPVPDGTYTITGPDGEVPADLLDSISSFDYVYESFGTPSPKELVFAASEVPGFGIQLFYVERTAAKTMSLEQAAPQLRFGTETTGFEIDDVTGLLKSVTMNGQTLQITQQLLYYNGYNGDNNGMENQASGAYIFRPKENGTTAISDSVTVTSTTGALVDEVRQEVNSWITQIIRVYKGASDNYIEFDWLVGPIEVDGDIGREIVSKFTIQDFDNSETFYTDANGREMLKRQVNMRYDYEYDPTLEPISSNYYPVTSKIVLRDESKNLEVALLNDRAQGGSSLENGVFELMVHRRLLRDDAFGVGEGLDDIEFNQGVVARGQHYLVIGPAASNLTGDISTAAKERELALKALLSPLVLVSDASSDDLSLENVQTALNFQFDGIKTTLPRNVHILTLEPWQENGYLLRLEHILENSEDTTLSQSVTVDLTGLFTLFDITEIRETTLAANHWLDEFATREKFTWKVKGGDQVVNQISGNSVMAADLLVSLEPMQIRTFIIQVSATK